MELLDFYKAIETKSTDMLQAAMSSNWQAVADCEKACAVLIGELRAQAEAQTLSAQERKEKTRIMQPDRPCIDAPLGLTPSKVFS